MKYRILLSAWMLRRIGSWITIRLAIPPDRVEIVYLSVCTAGKRRFYAASDSFRQGAAVTCGAWYGKITRPEITHTCISPSCVPRTWPYHELIVTCVDEACTRRRHHRTHTCAHRGHKNWPWAEATLFFHGGVIVSCLSSLFRSLVSSISQTAVWSSRFCLIVIKIIRLVGNCREKWEFCSLLQTIFETLCFETLVCSCFGKTRPDVNRKMSDKERTINLTGSLSIINRWNKIVPYLQK